MTTDRPDFWDQVYPSRSILGDGQYRLDWNFDTRDDEAIAAETVNLYTAIFTEPADHRFYVTSAICSCEASCLQCFGIIDYHSAVNYVIAEKDFDVNCAIHFPDWGVSAMEETYELRLAVTNYDTVARHFRFGVFGTYEEI